MQEFDMIVMSDFESQGDKEKYLWQFGVMSILKGFFKLCFPLCDFCIGSVRLLACFPKQEENKLEVWCFFDLFHKGQILKVKLRWSPCNHVINSCSQEQNVTHNCLTSNKQDQSYKYCKYYWQIAFRPKGFRKQNCPLYRTWKIN